jgi:hypothetical protein
MAPVTFVGTRVAGVTFIQRNPDNGVAMKGPIRVTGGDHRQRVSDELRQLKLLSKGLRTKALRAAMERHARQRTQKPRAATPAKAKPAAAAA